MKVLLTRDQEATLWNFQQSLITPKHGTILYSPYYLKHLGGGEYERLTFDQLPEEAKEMLLAKQGIKLPINEAY